MTPQRPLAFLDTLPTHATSDAIAAKLDAAFREPIPARAFEDGGRFGAWSVVDRLQLPGGASRWLLRDGARAMIWVDVDASGLARGWQRTSKAHAYLLDLAFEARFTQRQLQAAGERLRIGNTRPANLADLLEQAGGKSGVWCGHWVDAEGFTRDLWLFPRTGLVALASNGRKKLVAVECVVGMRAYELLVAAARAAGDLQD
jgi:hypothetical protein